MAILPSCQTSILESNNMSLELPDLNTHLLIPPLPSYPPTPLSWVQHRLLGKCHFFNLPPPAVEFTHTHTAVTCSCSLNSIS